MAIAKDREAGMNKKLQLAQEVEAGESGEVKETTPAPKEKVEKYKPKKKSFLLRYTPEMENQLIEIANKLADDEGSGLSINRIILKALREFIKKYGD